MPFSNGLVSSTSPLFTLRSRLPPPSPPLADVRGSPECFLQAQRRRDA